MWEWEKTGSLPLYFFISPMWCQSESISLKVIFLSFVVFSISLVSKNGRSWGKVQGSLGRSTPVDQLYHIRPALWRSRIFPADFYTQIQCKLLLQYFLSFSQNFKFISILSLYCPTCPHSTGTIDVLKSSKFFDCILPNAAFFDSAFANVSVGYFRARQSKTMTWRW